jgi:hypothetical protein
VILVDEDASARHVRATDDLHGQKTGVGPNQERAVAELDLGNHRRKSRTMSSPYRSIFMVSSGSARLWIADTAIAEHDRELATWTPLHTAKRPRSFVIEKLDIAFRE